MPSDEKQLRSEINREIGNVVSIKWAPYILCALEKYGRITQGIVRSFVVNYFKGRYKIQASSIAFTCDQLDRKGYIKTIRIPESHTPLYELTTKGQILIEDLRTKPLIEVLLGKNWKSRFPGSMHGY